MILTPLCWQQTHRTRDIWSNATILEFFSRLPLILLTNVVKQKIIVDDDDAVLSAAAAVYIVSCLWKMSKSDTSPHAAIFLDDSNDRYIYIYIYAFVLLRICDAVERLFSERIKSALNRSSIVF
jgi:hypothetical protein